MISKKILDKINFIAELLTDDTIIADEQNLMKLLVQDTIANTSVSSVEFRVIVGNRSGETTVIDWVNVPVTSQSDIFEVQYTPNFTDESKAELEVKITDTDSNIYLVQNPNINLKVL